MARITLRDYNNEINDLIDHGQIEEAIAHWRKAVEAAPTATAALNGLATTYMELKQYENAAKYYRMWLKVEPKNNDAKAGLKKAQAGLKSD